MKKLVIILTILTVITMVMVTAVIAEEETFTVSVTVPQTGSISIQAFFGVPSNPDILFPVGGTFLTFDPRFLLGPRRCLLNG